MSSWKTFEDINAWQEARALTSCVYRATSAGAFAQDFGLRDQIQRSAVSVLSNIAEGFGRGGTKEFLNFAYIARGSLTEVKSQLYVALDVDYLDQEYFNKLFEQATRTETLLNGLIKHLRASDFRGSKFSISEPEAIESI